MDISQQIISDIVIHNKYAKYLTSKNRRETWNEIIDRNKEMHLNKFPNLKDEIIENYKGVYDKKILPSMRALQFSGKPIEINNARIYNCCYLPIDEYRCFSEIMFLLLSGCGVGYSVQNHHIDMLPEINISTKTKRYLVSDNIEGWADAIRVLMKSYLLGTPKPIFDFRDIRSKGARLITTGGKAPGAEPLKECLFQIQKILDRKKNGERLTSLECHDIVCFEADAVLSGGIRRAALISLFDLDDEDMLTCKFDNWYELNPQRGRANNSAMILRHKIKKNEFLNLWKKIEMSNSGEPGIYLSNDKNWGTNPCCLSGDSWIMTKNGPEQIKHISNKKIKVLKDGKFYETTDDGFYQTGLKKVFEIETNRGYKIKSTEDHMFLTEIGWKRLDELNINKDKLQLSNNLNIKSWNGLGGNREEGWLIGNLIGDGTYGTEDQAILTYWGEDQKYMKSKAYNFLKNNIVNLESRIKEFNKKQNKNPYIRISSKQLTSLSKKWGVIKGNKVINNIIERGSSDFYKGIIGGIFDADGCVWGESKQGIAVDISQSNLNTLEILQRMLSRLGIPSTISKSNEDGFRFLPGNNYKINKELEEYFCKANYILRISKKINVDNFFNLIFVNSEIKKNKYIELCKTFSKKLYKEKFLTKIKNIKYIGEEIVYDCTVPEVSCFDANGLIVHNCEISLKPFQFCNLVELNVSDVESQDDLNQRAKSAAFIGTLQASYTNFHYLRDIWKKTTEKEALIGVGMTGISSGEVFKYNLEEAAKIVKDENERVAKLIGINKASRTTTIKPSGTSSLVLGTSSGIHDWFAEYFIRTIRLGKNEALYSYLLIHHPELLEDDFFKPSIQSIVSIPQKAPKGAFIRKNTTALMLLERIKKFNTEWVRKGHRKGENTNNVSATVNIKPNEWGEVGEWMWNNRSFYNGLSVLPFDDHSYVQAPLQECTEEKYNEMMSYLHEIDLSKVIEIEDNTDLSGEVACGGGGGSCEINI